MLCIVFGGILRPFPNFEWWPNEFAAGRRRVEVSTYQRVRDVLADGEWHSIEELRKVSRFPERWLEELRKDGLEVMVDSYEGNVALFDGPGTMRRPDRRATA